jgi:hypothetical protein
MAIIEMDQLTPRESIQHDWSMDEFRMQSEHAIVMKKLEIEEQRLEAKWASWLRIPVTIIKLPVYLVMAFGYVIAMARKKNPPDKFWDYLR